MQESKTHNIQSELLKDYADIAKVEVLKPYLERIFALLNKIRRIILILKNFNEGSLRNIEELTLVVSVRNTAILGKIPTPKNRALQTFHRICEERLNQRRNIDNILAVAYANIARMMGIARKGAQDVNAFGNTSIIAELDEEKRLFIDTMKSQLQVIGIEVRNFDELEDLDAINELAFDKGFIDSARRAKRVIKLNRIVKRTCIAYAAIFNIGLQMILPTYLTAMQLTSNSTKIHYELVYENLKQGMSQVNFNTPDGVQISGLFVKNKNNTQATKAILLVHGRNFNATWCLPYVEAIRNSKDNVDFLAINLRNHGPETPNSLTRSTTFCLNESLDVVGSLNFLASSGYSEVIVYGHSIGGAAVTIALGEHKDKISPQINIKGAIIEKTFANFHDFLFRMHRSLTSNFGVNLVRALKTDKLPDTRIGSPSTAQSYALERLTESISGFSASEINPSEAIKNISSPVLVITNKGGDAMMTEDDSRTLANNAPHGRLLVVESQYNILAFRHNGEFENPKVLDTMLQFVENNFAI